MIRSILLVLWLSSDVSSFFVASPFRSGHPLCTRDTLHWLQVSSLQSEASSEVSDSSSESGVDSVAAEEEEPVLDAAVEEEESPPEKQSPKRTERHTVYVGNIPYSMDVSSVRDLLSQHVDIGYVNLPRDKETGVLKGYAFADVATADDIPKAVDALNGMEVEGRKLRVSRYLSKDQIRSAKDVQGQGKLYVGNLPFDATREQVAEYFEEFGEILDVFLPINQYGDRRGFGFVSVKEEDVEPIIDKTNEVEFMGRKLVVNKPLPPGEKVKRQARPKTTKIFVGNLSFYTYDETLEEVFEEFGRVIDCYIPKDVNSGNSRGFGFVTMESDAANEAIAALDGCELDGRIISANEARKRSPKPQSFDDEEELAGEDVFE